MFGYDLLLWLEEFRSDVPALPASFLTFEGGKPFDDLCVVLASNPHRVVLVAGIEKAAAIFARIESLAICLRTSLLHCSKTTQLFGAPSLIVKVGLRIN